VYSIESGCSTWIAVVLEIVEHVSATTIPMQSTIVPSKEKLDNAMSTRNQEIWKEKDFETT
jgi:hypothetical protein